jgi:quinoprotein glucose dehydrogenase
MLRRLPLRYSASPRPRSPPTGRTTPGGPESTRYSPLKQITPANVGSLAVAWTYDTGDAFKGSEMQCQPVVAHGVLYASSPKLRVFALDAATGAPRWSFDPFEGTSTSRWTRIRGLMYWERGDERRIYFGAQHWLYALDATTGKKVASFGENGRIDLRVGFEGREPRSVSIRVNTPGVFYEDLLILGSVVPEALPSAPGDIRAFDVHTGRQRWSFHTIPHPGEPGYETWPKDAWKYVGGANAWAGLSLDVARGLVYAGTGSASYDFYGANRLGDNLFANSILCLKAATGERVWHFQAVKHDVWDRDFPAAPALITMTKDGKRRDVVAQIAKNGRTYVLDRETGEPIFPMEELRVKPSDVPGERLAPTQLLPTLPPPFTRQKFTEDMVTDRTPAAREAMLKEWRSLRSAGEYDPPSLQGTIFFPRPGRRRRVGRRRFRRGLGPALRERERAGVARQAGRAQLPSGRPTTGKELYQSYCAACHKADLTGAPPEFPSLVGIGSRASVDDVEQVVSSGGGRMPGFEQMHEAWRRAIVEYVVSGASVTIDAARPTPFDLRYSMDGYTRILDPDGFPAVKPPWGTLTAIDMNKAKIAWQVPLGEIPGSGIPNSGSNNYGGPVVTASGLVFIGATVYDKKFRAFDAATGTLLWETTLPASGTATPAVYEVNGRQFVVIAAGGGKWGEPSGGSYVAFALP